MNSSNEKQKSLEKTSEETFDSLPAESLSGAVLEFGTDLLLPDGPLKDFPFFNAFLGTLSTINSVSDYLLRRKIIGFLGPLENISEQKRKAFTERLKNDEAYRHRVAGNLILTLQNLNAFEKAEMIGRIFKAQILGEIEDGDFDALMAAVERINVRYIPELREYYRLENPFANGRSQGGSAALQSMATAGFISFAAGADTTIAPNNLGKLFLKVVLGEAPLAESGQ